jgi:hypothetical protein
MGRTRSSVFILTLKGINMKRINQSFTALAISIAAITALPAQAQVECETLTPARIDSINTALF